MGPTQKTWGNKWRKCNHQNSNHNNTRHGPFLYLSPCTLRPVPIFWYKHVLIIINILPFVKILMPVENTCSCVHTGGTAFDSPVLREVKSLLLAGECSLACLQRVTGLERCSHCASAGTWEGNSPVPHWDSPTHPTLCLLTVWEPIHCLTNPSQASQCMTWWWHAPNDANVHVPGLGVPVKILYGDIGRKNPIHGTVCGSSIQIPEMWLLGLICIVCNLRGQMYIRSCQADRILPSEPCCIFPWWRQVQKI